MDCEEDIKAPAGGGLDKEAQAKIVEKLFWGDNLPEDGFVPSVSPTDLKNVWNMWRDIEAHMPGQQVAIGVDVYKSVCGPNANVPAVNYSAAMLQMVRSFQQQKIGELPDACSEVDKSIRASTSPR